MKQVRSDNQDGEFATRELSVRGTTYVVRELGLDEYKDCLKQAEQMSGQESGFYRWGDLVDLMTLRAVSPSITSRPRPLPYPIYRMLYNIVEQMHFTDVAEDEIPSGGPVESDDDEEEGESPNS